MLRAIWKSCFWKDLGRKANRCEYAEERFSYRIGIDSHRERTGGLATLAYVTAIENGADLLTCNANFERLPELYI